MKGCIMIENFRWLAGVIATHKDRQIVGRTRLQKEIKLLQRLDLPTRYQFTIHFYGPYSEGLHAELGLLERMGLVSEQEEVNQQGKTYFIVTAAPEAVLEEVAPFTDAIRAIESTDAVVLELAATYDAFREMGDDRENALRRLRRKKG